MTSHVFRTYDEKTLIVVMHMANGEQTPMHQHDYPHDLFITRGRLRLDIGGIVKELEPGDTVHCPNGAMHQLTAIADDTIVIAQHDAAKAG